MKTPLFKQDDVDGFSTSFGDMVFGVLFFFFILSLTIIFNRPDVKSFHDQQDKLSKQLKEKDVIIQELERQIALWKTKVSKNKKAIDKLQEQIKQREYEFNKLKNENNALLKAQDALKLKNQELNSKNYALSKKCKDAEQNLKDLQKTHDRTLKYLKEAQKMVEGFDKAFKEIKKMLKQSGYLDLLAEIEKTQNKEEGQGQQLPPLDIIKLYVKLFGAEDFDIRIFNGDRQQSSQSSARADDVLRLAANIAKDYKSNSAAYNEEDKLKFSPRIYLMCNPEVPYGDVQAFFG